MLDVPASVLIALLLLFASPAPAASVRSVDFTEAPEMADFSKKAHQIGDEMYPVVLKLMAEDPSILPQQFDLVFRKTLKVPAYALPRERKIVLNAEWFTKHPDDVGAVVHEMVHIAQDHAPGAPSYWTEGVADYVRHKLGYTNSWSHPRCSAEFPHYTSGYWCTSAFLMYLDEQFGSNIVHQLNAALRQRPYSDAFFAGATGKPIEQLWADFQKTPYHKPGAAKAWEAKQREACTNQLYKIHQAIQAFQQENGRLPHWLSELAPRYVSSTNVLICPVTRRTKEVASFGVLDPLLPAAYVYEFSATRIPWLENHWVTMKQFKLRQKELVGDGIPMVRCHLHQPVLNLAYNGDVFESPTGWEQRFTNATVRAESLSVNALFPEEQKK